MEEILKYFVDFTDQQRAQFAQLDPFYREWNEKINLVSRKDIDNLYPNHILHSLAILKFMKFKPQSRILDVGTGGGFPGIPLAIALPDVDFYLVDSIGKKINVVKDAIEVLGLKNVQAQHIRAEDLKVGSFDFVVSRAVAPLPDLMRWSQKHISKTHKNILPNGLIALKGGNVKAEIKTLWSGTYADSTPVKKYFNLPHFEDKYVVYVQGWKYFRFYSEYLNES